MQAVMEAIIYVAEEPVKAEQFQEVFPEESPEAIRRALAELLESFNARPGGMWIREVAGGYRMTTRPEHHEQIRAYLKTRPGAKLSMAALETLAVIAYKQPVTLAEILAIRGRNRAAPCRRCSSGNWCASWGARRWWGVRFSTGLQGSFSFISA